MTRKDRRKEREKSLLTRSKTLAGMAAAVMIAVAASSLALCAEISEDEKSYSYELEAVYGLPEGVVMAVAETESGLDPEAGNGTCEGLMGIHRRYAAHYAELAGLEAYDLHDARHSMTIGSVILAEHLERCGGDLNRALMCYNLGAGGAAEKWRSGVKSTWYSRTVMERMEKYARPADDLCEGLLPVRAEIE